MSASWFDHAIATVAPRMAARRVMARQAFETLTRGYDGAARGRRTEGWRAPGSSADTEIGVAGALLRDRMRDLVRNNPHAAKAVAVLVNNIIGAGIMPRAASGDDTLDRKVDALFERWTAECDADGQLDFYGLQTLICREMVEAGEVLVRRRLRRASDGLPVPLQLQVLEADFLDATKSGVLGAGRLVQGIEFDPVGKRRAYWLHAEHPGDVYGALQNGLQSRPVPATEIAHIYEKQRTQGNIAGGEGFDWFYASTADRTAQVRTPISDGAAAKPWVFRYKDLRVWWSNPHYDRPGGVESGTPTAWASESKPIWFTELGCPAIDRGTNQPNVFFDPKSSESFTPHFSRGWRDDAIQRAYLEATYLWWGEAVNNPLSSVYGGRMVHVPECAAWTWDARPYPFFPALTDVWTDGANWRLGHWLTGRVGSVSLAALVRHLCLRAGLPESRIDVSGLWGAVEGYAITALESPRASITTLSRHFGFDAVETEGVIRFFMRGRASVSTLGPDDLMAPREGDVLELTRGQETELPQALKWQIARADEDYDAALVEARRITVDTTRIASESFPMAVPPEEAERRCRRALMEAWVGRETAAFRLPPSRLALDPADAIRLEHDGRLVDLRLVSIADADARGVEAVRQDRATYDLPPGDPRAASLTRAVVFGAPDAVLMDLPQLTEDQPAHRPLIAAHAVPWPGEMAVFRSPSTNGFELLTTFGSRARIGALVTDFYPGPSSRFDLGNALVVDLLTGTLESVTDLTLFGGANALAIESAPGVWEIVQAGAAELLAPGRYRLTRLLRGQRGTEDAMGNPVPAGARVVVLDTALASMPIAEADLGIPWNWRIGPASRPVSDATYVAQVFTSEGVGLRPFSVANVEQPWRTPRTVGDLTIRWTRRSRALSADSWGGLEVPLAEELEVYEVEILDGAAVKRVLSTTTTSAIYTAAQQTADWGAPLGPSDTLDIRIYQLSALVGRGAPKTVTLIL